MELAPGNPAGQPRREPMLPWEWMTRALAASFRVRVLVLGAVGAVLCGLIGPPPAAPGSALDWLRLALCLVWWALVGGAIARCCAAVLTFREPPSLAGAMAGSARRLGRSLPPAFGVLAACLLLLAPLWLHGAVMGIPVVATLSALLLPVPIACAILAAVLLVLLALNWPLMVACSAIERTDAFDVTSRAFAYVTQRPVRLGAYLLTAALAAAPVAVVAVTVDAVVRWFAADLLPTPVADPTTAGRIAQFWLVTLDGLATKTFVAAYGWCAATAVYLLLRRDIDGEQLDEMPDQPA